MTVGVVEIEQHIALKSLSHTELQRIVIRLSNRGPDVECGILRMEERIVEDRSWSIVPLQLPERIVGNVSATNGRHGNSLVGALSSRQAARHAKDRKRARESWQNILEPGNVRNLVDCRAGIPMINQLIDCLVPGLTRHWIA